MRACNSCGVADWQPCVCADDRADRERDDHPTLVAIREIPYGYCHCGCGEKTALARDTDWRQGLVKGEPRRFRHTHASRLREPKIEWLPEDRGYETPCHIWQGTIAPSSRYGRATWRGKLILPHRLAWILAHGSIPDGLHVLHKCDVPACGRPDHLFLGTQVDNMRDMAAKGRGAMSFAKLTVEDVRAIRESQASNAELALAYGVRKRSISYVRRRLTWRHVA